MGILDRIQNANSLDDTAFLQQVAEERNKSASQNNERKSAIEANWELKQTIKKSIVEELSHEDKEPSEGLIYSLITNRLDAINSQLSQAQRQSLAHAILNDILNYGPIQPLLDDQTISEIMINGYDQIYIERDGVLERLHDTYFEDDDHVMRIINKMVSGVGRRCDEASPYVNARLKDGSRVNAIIPPLSVNGPTLTIRKFSARSFGIDELIENKTLSVTMAKFLRAAVQGKLNILVTGGTGSGKTTLLNVISSFISDDERIITIEDVAELMLHQEHVVSLEARPKSAEGTGEVTIQQLVVNALRMRPDRILVGECRAGEALDMLQAMNTGHDGSLSTAHANSPKDALSRLENMVYMAGYELPRLAIQEQIVSALDLIVQVSRVKEGPRKFSRKVTHIQEVESLDPVSGVITRSPLFEFDYTTRKFLSTGAHAPKLVEKMAMYGVDVDHTWFNKGEHTDAA